MDGNDNDCVGAVVSGVCIDMELDRRILHVNGGMESCRLSRAEGYDVCY